MMPYRKYAVEQYSFKVIDNTLPLDNALHFQKILLEEVQRIVVLTNDGKISGEKLQYDIKVAPRVQKTEVLRKG